LSITRVITRNLTYGWISLLAQKAQGNLHQVRIDAVQMMTKIECRRNENVEMNEWKYTKDKK